MTKRQRTFLFFTFLSLFLVSTPLLLLYYAGYRFDFKQKIVTQTGGIYLKVHPKSVSLSLNLQDTKNTDWLFGTALIDNLLPQSYRVLAEKEGYIPWEKTLEVQKTKVTEAKNILLLPKHIQTKTFTNEVGMFWVSPDHSFVLLQKSSLSKGKWLSLWNMQINSEHIVWEKLVGEVSSVSWREDSGAILIQLKSKTGFLYLLHEIEKDTRELKFLGKDTTKVIFASSSNTNILLEKTSSKENSLLLGDYQSQTLSAPFATSVLTFNTFGDSLFWIDSQGSLWKKEILSSSPPSPLSSPEAFSLNKQAVSLFPTSKRMFLQQGTSLMLFNEELRRFETIQTNVKEFSLAPDKKKIALGKENEVTLFFLEEDADQPQRNKGEVVPLASFENPISNVTWITSHYLLFLSGNALKVIEIDTRDRINIADLGLFSSFFFWNDKEKSLFLLKEGSLSLSEKLF